MKYLVCLLTTLLVNVTFSQRMNDNYADNFVDFAPEVSDSVIADRFNSIEAEMDLSFNSKVRGFIDYFTIRNRDYTRKLLIRQSAYFPIFERKLAEHNLPDDLKYLTMSVNLAWEGWVSTSVSEGFWVTPSK